MKPVPAFKAPWFITIMGTGMSSTILQGFPYPTHWLRVCGYIMFGVCSCCLAWTVTHFVYTMVQFPKERRKYLFDISCAPFLGCLAMGYTSWLIGLTDILDGRGAILLYVLWWISNVISLITAWVIPFFFLKGSEIRTSQFTMVLLLPLVSLTVTASAGGVIGKILPENLQLSTIVLSLLFAANAIIASFMVLTIYSYRLLIYHFPPKLVIFTSFIPMGFLGQGAFAIQLCGQNFYKYMSTGGAITERSNIEGLIIQWVLVLTALFLESLGFFITFFAFASVLSHGKHDFHFGWWAMTFPLGTMSHATALTYELTGWGAFHVLSAIYGVGSVCWTLICMCGTLYECFKWGTSVLMIPADLDVTDESADKPISV